MQSLKYQRTDIKRTRRIEWTQADSFHGWDRIMTERVLFFWYSDTSPPPQQHFFQAIYFHSEIVANLLSPQKRKQQQQQEIRSIISIRFDAGTKLGRWWGEWTTRLRHIRFNDTNSFYGTPLVLPIDSRFHPQSPSSSSCQSDRVPSSGSSADWQSASSTKYISWVAMQQKIFTHLWSVINFQ